MRANPDRCDPSRPDEGGDVQFLPGARRYGKNAHHIALALGTLAGQEPDRVLEWANAELSAGLRIILARKLAAITAGLLK